VVTLGHVALDGTKIRANASKHKAMSYGRMQKEETRLAAEVAAMLRRAEETDAAEDARYGPDVSGDEVPAELRRREDRLRKIREAKAALETAAKPQAEAERARRAAATPPGPRRGRPPKPPRETPRDRDQYNFTDPESHLMKSAEGAFIQAYNAQAAVDGQHQIIVAADVSTQAKDAPHLVPLVEAIEHETGQRARRVSAAPGTSVKTTSPRWPTDRSMPSSRRRSGCSGSFPPRLGTRSARNGRRSSSRSSDRSKRPGALADSSCVG